MAKNITKKIENFVSILQNSTFVNERINPHVEQFNVIVGRGISKSKITINRSIKYVNGKARVRLFLINSLKSFDTQHATLFSMIEKGDLIHHPESKVKYDSCKQSIGIILRANRRLNKRITNNHMVTSYINQYIHEKRLERKYNLAI